MQPGRRLIRPKHSLAASYVCKLGWWEQVPWDVRAYAERHPSYPCDSTLEQLYDGAEFEAYRELGASAVSAAINRGGLPLPLSAGPGQT